MLSRRLTFTCCQTVLADCCAPSSPTQKPFGASASSWRELTVWLVNPRAPPTDGFGAEMVAQLGLERYLTSSCLDQRNKAELIAHTSQHWGSLCGRTSSVHLVEVEGEGERGSLEERECHEGSLDHIHLVALLTQIQKLIRMQRQLVFQRAWVELGAVLHPERV